MPAKIEFWDSAPTGLRAGGAPLRVEVSTTGIRLLHDDQRDGEFINLNDKEWDWLVARAEILRAARTRALEAIGDLKGLTN